MENEDIREEGYLENEEKMVMKSESKENEEGMGGIVE